jgi:hypothetical protein
MEIKSIEMKHRTYSHICKKERPSKYGAGIFFILLGISLLIATNDLLHLGSVSDYFTWQTILVFMGTLFIFNCHFIVGLLFISGGIWFLLDKYYIVIPDFIRNLYWPSIIILIGFSYLISSFFKKGDDQLNY